MGAYSQLWASAAALVNKNDGPGERAETRVNRPCFHPCFYPGVASLSSLFGLSHLRVPERRAPNTDRAPRDPAPAPQRQPAQKEQDHGREAGDGNILPGDPAQAAQGKARGHTEDKSVRSTRARSGKAPGRVAGAGYEVAK